MSNFQISAKHRSVVGRKVKRLRKEGILPANIYGKGVKSQTIEVDFSQFIKLSKEAGESTLVNVDLAGKKLPALIHNTQIDPITEMPKHVDFLQVNLKEKVTADVPVELVGESPAEKQGLGTVVQYIDEIEVEALPADLPEKFEVNLESLSNLDDSIQVKDIKVDDKKIAIKENSEEIIVKIEAQKIEVEQPVATSEEVATEAGVTTETEASTEETQESSEDDSK